MRNRKTDSTITMRVMCAISFILYIFLFVSGYQSSTLIYLQHVLSDGKTYYDPLIGGCILTCVLMLVQWLTSRYAKLPSAFHVLTYVPSMLLLIIMTDFDVIPAEKIGELGSLSPGTFVWFIPLIAIVYFGIIIFARQWIPMRQRVKTEWYASFTVVFTLLLMAIMMGTTTYLANGDKAFQRIMKAERAFANSNYETLAHISRPNPDAVSADSYATADTTLTLYRAIALSHNGSMGDSLFYAPVTGSMASLTLFEGVRLYDLPFDNLRKEVKNIRENKNRHIAGDYILAGLLLSRDLDIFARTLPHYYAINDSLPRHYKEALVIYQHSRSNPVTSYLNDVMEIDYDGIQEIYHKYGNNDERTRQILRQYRRSYWAYYLSN